MGLLDDLKEKATDLAQTGVATSKRLAEIAKLKTSNIAEEDTIKRAYLELGKLYYAEHGATPEGGYAAACERISTAKANISSNNDRIAALKTDVETTSDTVVDVAPTVVEDVTSAAPAQPQEEAQPAEETKTEE